VYHVTCSTGANPNPNANLLCDNNCGGSLNDHLDLVNVRVHTLLTGSCQAQLY